MLPARLKSKTFSFFYVITIVIFIFIDLAKMCSFRTHIFDLPPELLDEIFKRMNLQTLLAVEKTCGYMDARVKLYRETHKESYNYQVMCDRAYVDDYSSDSFDDYLYDGSDRGFSPPSYHFSDDELSFGSGGGDSDWSERVTADR